MPKTSADRIERGKRLLEARRRAGLTQPELADLSGVSRPSISSYENGKRVPTEANAKKLAAALDDLEMDDLLEVLSPSFLAQLTDALDWLRRRAP